MLLKILARTAGCTFGNIAFFFACLVPKNRKLWIFSAWNGRKYLDNPKYIYRFLNEHQIDVSVVWVVKDKNLYDEMRQMGLPVAYAYSVRGIACQLRAGIVVFTHSVAWDFISCFIGCGVKRVQTWHGMPIKKIGYDDARYSSFRTRLRALLLPYENDRLDLVIAGSEADKSKYCTAFNVHAEKIRITGYPRNDEIVRSIARSSLSGERGKKVIYMPTLRGAVGSEFRLLEESNFDFETADRMFREIDVDFYIKLHPVQVFSKRDLDAIYQSSQIHAVGNEGDIYEQIGTFDILITDFSGIYFDFLITGKPIIMAPLDLANYLRQDRELYYSYEDLCPDKPCASWNDVLLRLRKLVQTNCSSSETYRQLQQKFHMYLDANSSQRVCVELNKLAGVEHC